MNANMLNINNPKPQNKLVIPNTSIEMKSDSIYYSILASMIQNTSEGVDLQNTLAAQNHLSQSQLSDITSGAAN